MKYSLTRHAQQRKQQRGFQEQDIALIVECGTQVRRDLHLLRSRDVDREIQQYKRRIQDLERLRGSAVVVAEDSVITCYHLSGQPGRRTLKGRGKRRRRSRKRSFS